MTLTTHELRIMRIVWARGEVKVRDVYEELRAHRQIAYTTAMTMMNILVRKGRLRKRHDGKAYVYRPLGSREDALAELVRELIDEAFDGSTSSLIRAAKAVSQPLRRKRV